MTEFAAPLDALIIRQEALGDASPIRHVNEQAFGQTEEANLVEALRRRGAFTLSLVALLADQIVGHILFTPVVVESPGRRVVGMGLAPMAVLPERQRQGIIPAGCVRPPMPAGRNPSHEGWRLRGRSILHLEHLQVPLQPRQREPDHLVP